MKFMPAWRLVSVAPRPWHDKYALVRLVGRLSRFGPSGHLPTAGSHCAACQQPLLLLLLHCGAALPGLVPTAHCNGAPAPLHIYTPAKASCNAPHKSTTCCLRCNQQHQGRLDWVMLLRCAHKHTRTDLCGAGALSCGSRGSAAPCRRDSQANDVCASHIGRYSRFQTYHHQLPLPTKSCPLWQWHAQKKY